MAASYVRDTEQRINNGSNNVTIDTTGSDGIVLTFAFSVHTDSITSVSYQGKAGTLVATKADAASKVEVWIIPAPELNAAGTLNVVCVNSSFCYLTAVMILAGAQSFGNNTANVTSGALSIAASSDASCIEIGVMVMAAIYTITPGASQTNISTDTAAGNYYCRTDYKAGAAGSTTMSWTPSSNSDMAGIMVSITVLGALFSCPGMIG